MPIEIFHKDYPISTNVTFTCIIVYDVMNRRFWFNWNDMCCLLHHDESLLETIAENHKTNWKTMTYLYNYTNCENIKHWNESTKLIDEIELRKFLVTSQMHKAPAFTQWLLIDVLPYIENINRPMTVSKQISQRS